MVNLDGIRARLYFTWECVTIMGPGGAGKSTLLALLGLYDPAWEGAFCFAEYPVHRLPAKDRGALNKRSAGCVFQQFQLLDDLTVAENLEIPLSYRNIPHVERQAPVADALDRFYIVGKKDLSFPASSPAGGNIAWRWPGRWGAGLPFCWRTSPPAISPPRTAPP